MGEAVDEMAIKNGSGLSALPYTVIRIRAGDPQNRAAIHTGTGFFYGLTDEGQMLPLVVSNKHVLCDKSWIEFDFAVADANGERVLGPPQRMRIESGHLPIFEHPDPNVDLAAMPLNPLLATFEGTGLTPHALLLSDVSVPPRHIQSILHAATSVLMVGFPNGIMDEANNLPVVRRGALAMPYKADYQGEANFAVDIAAFGGSSGSPVFAYFDHLLPDESGGVGFTTEPLIFFIGVLHSGPQMTAEGEVVSVPVPTGHFLAQTKLMIHLGYCLKAFRIQELLPVIRQFMAEHPAL